MKKNNSVENNSIEHNSIKNNSFKTIDKTVLSERKNFD